MWRCCIPFAGYFEIPGVLGHIDTGSGSGVHLQERHMQTRNPIMDDISRMMQGAAGMAQAANDEAKALFRSGLERVVADMDLVKREEFEAMKTLARNALEKVEALERRVAELEGDKGGDTADRRS